jgi:hypothetical protein
MPVGSRPIWTIACAALAGALLWAPALLYAAAWQAVVSREGGFRVLMPGTPELEQATHKSIVGTVREYTYSVDSDGKSFSASYSVLPGIAASLGGPARIFDSAKTGLLEDVGGAETRFTDISLHGHPGKELTFRARPGAQGKPMAGQARMYLVHRILYVLVAKSPAPGDPDVARFLGSLELTNPASP